MRAGASRPSDCSINTTERVRPGRDYDPRDQEPNELHPLRPV